MKSVWEVVHDTALLHNNRDLIKFAFAQAQSVSGNQPEIDKLVDYLVFGVRQLRPDGLAAINILQHLGDQVFPRALAILRDGSLRDRLTTITNKDPRNPECPVDRVCDIFWNQDLAPPSEVVGLLAPHICTKDGTYRQVAILVITSTGADESIPLIRQFLSGVDPIGRCNTLGGIEHAAKEGRIHPQRKDEYFNLVAALWPNDNRLNVAGQLPGTLLAIDRPRAIEFLLSDELFNSQFPSLCYLLAALSEASAVIPRSRLLAIIDESRDPSSEHHNALVLTHALPLLGAHSHADDLPLLESYLDSNYGMLVDGAIQAIYRFYKYYDRFRDPQDAQIEFGWRALTVHEKLTVAVLELDSEIGDGGFLEYYSGYRGDRWQFALAGLGAIGATVRLRRVHSHFASREFVVFYWFF